MRLRYFLPALPLVLGLADAASAYDCAVVAHAQDYRNENQKDHWNQDQNQNQRNDGSQSQTNDWNQNPKDSGNQVQKDSWNENQNDGWNGNTDDASVSALADSQPAWNSISMATHTVNAHDVTVAGVISATAVPTTLMTMTTRAAEAVSAAAVSAADAMSAAEAMPAAETTSNFVLTATAVPKADRRPQTNSSSTLAMAVVVPLLALIAIVSAIVFRMYRTKKEREEAFAAEAVRAKTRAIEKQMEDLDAISEKYDMGKYRADAKGLADAKSYTVDIPIQLEADEPNGRRFHGL